MKKQALWLCLAAAINIGVVTGCKMHKAGSVPKNTAVPGGRLSADSSGTTPSAKLTPSPVPNNRPNPKPVPMPPDPE